VWSKLVTKQQILAATSKHTFPIFDQLGYTLSSYQYVNVY